MGNVIRNSRIRNVKPIAIFLSLKPFWENWGLVGKNLKIYFLIGNVEPGQLELKLKISGLYDKFKFFNFFSFGKWVSEITPSNALLSRLKVSRLDCYPKLSGIVPFK